MFIVFFGSVVIADSPLNAVQMLWVNLIMDTLAALALATEPPAADILTRMPYDKDAAIVTQVMWRNVFGHSIYQIIALILVIFVGCQDLLCHNYNLRCEYELNTGVSIPTCKENTYNPFYTESLYITEEEIKEWNNLGLSVEHYDQTLLKDFKCQIAKEEFEESDNADEEF